MKKALLTWLILLLCVCLWTCRPHYRRISANQVEGISMHYMDDNYRSWYYDLETNDIKTFVRLYNNSQYAGEACGELGTQSYNLNIYLKNGDVIYIDEAAETYPRMEVSTKSGAWYWIDSEELFSYIWELIGKYHVPNP